MSPGAGRLWLLDTPAFDLMHQGYIADTVVAIDDYLKNACRASLDA
jgi:hypothetical protein